jgi:hypothetical protein
MPFQFLKPIAEGGLLWMPAILTVMERDYSAGNCFFGPTLERSTFNWKKGPPFMIYNHYCPIKKVKWRIFPYRSILITFLVILS